MRTTLTLDDDVAKQLVQLQREGKRKFREIVNDALREGLRQLQRPPKRRAKYKIQPVALGPSKVGNLDNVAEALAVAEGEAYR
jgi:hypothetical protein